MSRRWPPILLGIVAAAVLAACGGPEGRQKVLSFFFDGVPPPEQEAGEAPGTESSRGPQEQVRYKEHGPYAARLCDSCHEQGTNRVVLPRDELCGYCHVLKTDREKIHGPLASGGCMVCHEPHGSMHPFYLTGEPGEFCLYCHDGERLRAGQVHQDLEMGCTECHDAHSADNVFLLKGVRERPGEHVQSFS